MSSSSSSSSSMEKRNARDIAALLILLSNCRFSTPFQLPIQVLTNPRRARHCNSNSNSNSKNGQRERTRRRQRRDKIEATGSRVALFALGLDEDKVQSSSSSSSSSNSNNKTIDISPTVYFANQLSLPHLLEEEEEAGNGESIVSSQLKQQVNSFQKTNNGNSVNHNGYKVSSSSHFTARKPQSAKSIIQVPPTLGEIKQSLRVSIQIPTLMGGENKSNDGKYYNMFLLPAEKVAEANGAYKAATKLFMSTLDSSMNTNNNNGAGDDEETMDQNNSNNNNSSIPEDLQVSLENFLSPIKDSISSTVKNGTESFRQMDVNAFVITPIRNFVSSTFQNNNTESESEQVPTQVEEPEERLSMRRLWRRRHARTLEEGIRRQKATALSVLLNRAQIDARKGQDRRLVERTFMGLLNALAEEVEDLDIEFTTTRNTPIWRKEVKQVRINFSRLGFKPIRMGGSSRYDEPSSESEIAVEEEPETELSLVESADEAFDRIDKDNSGTLDREEIAEALSMISHLKSDKDSIGELASELVELYDVNSDGVVDREEYQQMVEDMAKLRPVDEEKLNDKQGPLQAVQKSVQSISKGISEKAAQVASSVTSGKSDGDFDPDEKETATIILSDLSLDLRRLVFGSFPIIKRITPGGPLILEPFTATLKGSFSREDVMGSFLLDSGLRLLVARALRLRVRSFRDIVDGAYFFGRRWKMASKTAPVVEVLGLSNVEFDKQNKLIITGRARIRTSPDALVVTNTFKVRTKIGTRKNGQKIRLVEPELAFVFECPEAWENGLGLVCEQLGMPPLKRPEPVYSFFPIYSPFKVNDESGFDMGEDNRLRNIFIKDGKLRFEMRSVLRPGRFLGNHYLAFTIPNRTFIVTMDRVKEGMRAARKNKKIAARANKLASDYTDTRNFSVNRAVKKIRKAAKKGSTLRRRLTPLRWKKKKPKGQPKSFFSRFVEGYTLVEREGDANNERLTNEISDWFGRQGSTETTNSTTEEA